LRKGRSFGGEAALAEKLLRKITEIGNENVEKRGAENRRISPDCLRLSGFGSLSFHPNAGPFG